MRTNRAVTFLCGVASLWLAGQATGQTATWTPPGPNLALNKGYQFSRPSDYYLCSKDDAGDNVQLTDGVYVPGHIRGMWHHQACVGWGPGRVGITIDLGEVRAIGGLSYSTEAATAPGVNWPPAVLILVSDIGQEFTPVGELVALSAKFGPPSGLRYRFVTDDLNVRGRYVQLIIQSSLQVFTDEIEIYEARDPEVTKAPTGAAMVDPLKYMADHITELSVTARVATDIAQACRIATNLVSTAADRQRIGQRFEALYARALKPEPTVYGPDFRGIAPLNALHAEVFSELGSVYRALNYPELMLWRVNRWARQTPWIAPPRPGSAEAGRLSLNVRLMLNERRGEVINIAHFGKTSKMASITFTGLPGGNMPPYLTVRQAEYVAQQASAWDADALPAADKALGGWRVSLPAGLSRQVWLDFRPDQATCRPGRYLGGMNLSFGNGTKLYVPIDLTVEPLRMPDRKTVGVTMWDYTDCGGQFGLQDGPVAAAVAHMRDAGLDCPWAQVARWDHYSGNNSVFPWHVKASDFNSAGRLRTVPDFRVFDNWVSMWPGARYYFVHIAAHGKEGETFADALCGTPEFNQRVGEVMKAWVKHAEKWDIKPSQIALLIADEPNGGGKDARTVAWAEAIKAAVPEVTIYIDPMHEKANFEDSATRRMFELADIIEPPSPVYRRSNFLSQYEFLRDQGKKLGMYVAAQGSSEASPITYYRLQEWHCWRFRAVSSSFWAYGDTGGVKNNWTMINGGGARNFSPVYIDPKSVTDGKRWLAIFEGVQDNEYLQMIQRRVDELRAAKRSHSQLEEAEKLLANLANEVIEAANGGDLNACDAGRLRALDVLKALME